jgi:hypothetical protein
MSEMGKRNDQHRCGIHGTGHYRSERLLAYVAYLDYHILNVYAICGTVWPV